MTEQTKSRRADASRANGQKGGRPRVMDDSTLYAIRLPRTLVDWLKSCKTPAEVRDQLTKWMIEEHIA